MTNKHKIAAFSSLFLGVSIYATNYFFQYNSKENPNFKLGRESAICDIKNRLLNDANCILARPLQTLGFDPYTMKLPNHETEEDLEIIIEIYQMAKTNDNLQIHKDLSKVAELNRQIRILENLKDRN